MPVDFRAGYPASHLSAEGVISTLATAARKFPASSGAPISGAALDTTISAEISGRNASIQLPPRNNETYHKRIIFIAGIVSDSGRPARRDGRYHHQVHGG